MKLNLDICVNLLHTLRYALYLHNYLCSSVLLFRITIHCGNEINMIVLKVRVTKNAQPEIVLYFSFYRYVHIILLAHLS